MLGLLLRKIIDFFTPKEWILVEAYTTSWNIHHHRQGIEQKFVFYKIEFCPQLGKYRINFEGENPTKHRVYGEMLKRVADLNAGRDHFYNQPNIDDIESNQEGIVVVKFPLSNNPEDAWSFARPDKALIDVINEAKKKLKNDGVEIFEQRDNVIATDVGYYAAFWEKDFNAAKKNSNDKKDEDGEQEK